MILDYSNNRDPVLRYNFWFERIDIDNFIYQYRNNEYEHMLHIYSETKKHVGSVDFNTKSFEFIGELYTIPLVDFEYIKLKFY